MNKDQESFLDLVAKIPDITDRVTLMVLVLRHPDTIRTAIKEVLRPMMDEAARLRH